MPTVALTDKTVAAIKPGSGDFWDTKLTGFWVRAGDRRIVYRLRVPVGKVGTKWSYKVKTLGEVSQFKTVDEARKRAEIERGKVLDEHGDPDRERAEVRAKKLTLRSAWDQYIRHCEREGRSERTIAEYKAWRDRHFKKWLDDQLADIGSDEGVERVRELFKKITKESGKASANNAFRVLRAVYNYHRKLNRRLPENPCDAIFWNKVKPRQVGYAPEELKPVFGKICELQPVMAGLHCALLFTGVRGGAMMSAQRQHFDAGKHALHLTNHKGKPFDLPLSDVLVSLFKAADAIAEERFPGTTWLFPAFSEVGHIVEPRAALPAPAAFVAHREAKGTVTEDVRSHHYRNTFISLSEEAGLSDREARRLVDHKVAGDAHEGYKTASALFRHLVERQGVMSAYLLRTVGLPEGFRFTTDWFKADRKIHNLIN